MLHQFLRVLQEYLERGINGTDCLNLHGFISNKGVHMLGLELLVIKEINTRGVSVCLKPSVPELITPTLASEIRHFQNSLAEKYYLSPWEDDFYIIWYSQRGHGTSWNGIDFKYILNAIRSNKEFAFELYIREVFDLLFLNYVGLGLPVVNCSIVDRVVTGISQEFFFLNKINFIKSYPADILGTKISPVNYNDISSNLIFPKFIYHDNHFYKFSYFDIKTMRDLIKGTESNLFNDEKLESIRHVFEEIKNETITKVYHLASTNMQLLKRMAETQLIKT